MNCHCLPPRIENHWRCNSIWNRKVLKGLVYRSGLYSLLCWLRTRRYFYPVQKSLKASFNSDLPASVCTSHKGCDPVGKFSTPPGGERKTNKSAPMGGSGQDVRYGNGPCETLLSTPLGCFCSLGNWFLSSEVTWDERDLAYWHNILLWNQLKEHIYLLNKDSFRITAVWLAY